MSHLFYAVMHSKAHHFPWWAYVAYGIPPLAALVRIVWWPVLREGAESRSS